MFRMPLSRWHQELFRRKVNWFAHPEYIISPLLQQFQESYIPKHKKSKTCHCEPSQFICSNIKNTCRENLCIVPKRNPPMNASPAPVVSTMSAEFILKELHLQGKNNNKVIILLHISKKVALNNSYLITPRPALFMALQFIPVSYSTARMFWAMMSKQATNSGQVCDPDV